MRLIRGSTMIPCTPLAAAFLAAGTAAVTSVFHRALAMKGMKPCTVAFSNSLLGALFLLAALPMPASLATVDPLSLALLLLEGVLWAYAVLFDIRSLASTTVADSSLLSSLRFILLQTVGVSCFGESLTGYQGLGLLLIVLGTFYGIDLRSVDRAGLAPKLKSLTFAVAALSLDRILVQRVDPTLVIHAGYLGPALVYLLINRVSLSHVRNHQAKAWCLILLSSLFYAANGYYLVHSLQGESMSVAVTVYETRTILVLILGAIFLQERDGLKTKGVASILTIVGATLVAS